MATCASILAWRIPWTIESMGCKELDTTERFTKKKKRTVQVLDW